MITNMLVDETIEQVPQEILQDQARVVRSYWASRCVRVHSLDSASVMQGVVLDVLVGAGRIWLALDSGQAVALGPRVIVNEHVMPSWS